MRAFSLSHCRVVVCGAVFLLSSYHDTAEVVAWSCILFLVLRKGKASVKPDSAASSAEDGKERKSETPDEDGKDKDGKEAAAAKRPADNKLRCVAMSCDVVTHCPA